MAVWPTYAKYIAHRVPLRLLRIFWTCDCVLNLDGLDPHLHWKTLEVERDGLT